MTKSNTPTGGGTGSRLTAKAGCLMVEVITGKDGVSNAGDFCIYCILSTVALGGMNRQTGIGEKR